MKATVLRTPFLQVRAKRAVRENRTTVVSAKKAEALIGFR